MAEANINSTNEAAHRLLREAESIDISHLPEKIALYERGLALYPSDPELVSELSFKLARAFYLGGEFRLAKHRLHEAFSATILPSQKLIELESLLDDMDISQVSQYPEEFIRIGAPEFRKITYSVEKVWRLNVPIQEMPVAELEDHLNMRYWATPGNRHNLTPLEVLNNPKAHGHEYRRIEAANLTYPLDLCEWKGNWMMIDGLHRLAKAKLLGMPAITARAVPLEMLKSISTVFEE